MYDIACFKVNTLVRPDGVKKAYVRLTQDFDALDVANKIGECCCELSILAPSFLLIPVAHDRLVTVHIFLHNLCFVWVDLPGTVLCCVMYVVDLSASGAFVFSFGQPQSLHALDPFSTYAIS